MTARLKIDTGRYESELLRSLFGFGRGTTKEFFFSKFEDFCSEKEHLGSWFSFGRGTT